MKKLLVIVVCIMVYTVANSQKVVVKAQNAPLSVVLATLNSEISFDSNSLSKYTITLNKEFPDTKSAIDYLLADKPYDVELIGTVYVISPKVVLEDVLDTKDERWYTFVGNVVDGKSGEPLPYCQVVWSSGHLMTNENGLFQLRVKEEDTFRVKIHYLGYSMADSILKNSHSATFRLEPYVVVLKESVVSMRLSSMRMQQGESLGEIRVNHTVSKFLPGNGDNSVYTLLRSMPGVRASGEPSSELFVWGSGTGEGRIVYDGMTIFGLSNFNDNIGFINPFMVKDIRLHKAGYNASLGNAVGAISEIIGVEGDYSKVVFKASVNNLTLNLLGSVPLWNRSALTIAFRQSFNSLYDKEVLNPFRNNDSITSNLTVVPDYRFNDMNVKLSGNVADNDSYSFNFYTSNDQFDYQVTNFKRVNLEESASARQFGSSIGYNRVWKNGGVTSFLINSSQLVTDEDKISALLLQSDRKVSISNTYNKVVEFGVGFNHLLILNHQNSLSFGWQGHLTKTVFNSRDSLLRKPNIYIKNRFSKNDFGISYGFRLDMPKGLVVGFQPRVDADYQINRSLKVNLGGGVYNQYLQRLPLADSTGAFQLVWSIPNSKDVPILKSNNLVTGISYNHNGFLISLEGFYKYTTGVVALNKISQQVVSSTVSSQMIGTDLFMKLDIGRVTSFASVMLCNQDIINSILQQEYKGGGVLNLNPFYLSLNYVYGIGFNYLGTASNGDLPGYTTQFDKNYSRLDGSLIYKVNSKKMNLQIGFTVLNIFNTDNFKYRYQVPPSKILSGSIANIYLNAEAFTPSFFIEFGF